MAQWFEEPYFDRIAWILDHFDIVADGLQRRNDGIAD